MLLTVLILVADIFSLYILSRRVTQSLYTLFYRSTNNRSASVTLLIAILFPGTIIHELSHLFSAEILDVQTGKLRLVPDSIREDDINVGSVEIGSTDPIRRTMIGLAPFFVGLFALFVLSSLLPSLISDTVNAYHKGILFSSMSLYLCLFALYLLFTLSNTMFVSKEDMHGVIPFFIGIILIGIGLYAAGLRIGLTDQAVYQIAGVLSAITKSISLVVLLNLALYALTSLLLRLMQSIRKK